ncbi:hypothetical protein ACFPM3_29190 [Streptomyces coeruleoprunus]|uniref:Uncharacterized protein n=1 Tax=Streptomyces coeruleoprunus TaxID=285563 RepID=A0ABV9XMH6_9ACTN
MDGALADGDVDIAVGDDSGEALGDAAQFYGGGAGRVDDALSLARKERRSRRKGWGTVRLEVIAPESVLRALYARSDPECQKPMART